MQINASKAYLANDMLIIGDISLGTDFYSKQNNKYNLNTKLELLKTINNKWKFYLKNENILSKNNYINSGDNYGACGFPVRRQFSNKRFNLSAEARHYPNINLFNIFELGVQRYLQILAELQTQTP